MPIKSLVNDEKNGLINSGKMINFKIMIRPWLIFILFILSGAGLALKPETKYLKKAEQSIEKGNLKNAKSYYLRALARNPDSYEANLGIGLMLCELLDNHNEALPYLENALRLSLKDTLKDLAFALAQCYQYKGEFKKAIGFYHMLDGCVDYDNEIDLSKELQKRIDDCNYALTHANSPDPNLFIVNAGRRINTEMPEYVPVLTPDGELIFTSKRKDTPKEEVNYLDGKYYESMYISKFDSSGFSKVRRYTIPDYFIRSHFAKHHESVISISPDGKKLFTFKDNKIFEVSIKDRSRLKPKKLLKTVNFNYYQNHAYVSKDGKTLLFTSDASGGIGGNDIYISLKDENGQWGKPENLGSTINTSFDEEAPYLTNNGTTLYFSSRGHQGYGNFDIYRSNLIDGKWSIPENVGEPINSPGHDVFMVHDSTSSNAYFSSSRNGGYGDMDIYKIIFIDKIDKACPNSNNNLISLNKYDEDNGDFKNKIEVKVPANYKVLSYAWSVNHVPLTNETAILDYDYGKEGNYIISSKVVALCDTCLSPVISCQQLENIFSKPLAITDSLNTIPTKTSITELPNGVLNNEQLSAIGFNLSPLLFDFNKTEPSADANETLKVNSEMLKNHPELSVQLFGYCDSRGTAMVNKLVSYLRANQVKKLLLNNGVRPDQIKSVFGKGATDFVVNCDNNTPCDDKLHRQNRRVVFVVTKH